MELIEERSEGEVIPMGWSVTETSIAWYFRRRNSEGIITIRVPKTHTVETE